MALDLETTGVDPSSDRIIEVGLVRFKGDEEMGRFSTLVNPRMKISGFINRLTGIKQSDLNTAPDWERVAPLVRQFISDDPIVAHNVRFDAGFLRSHGVYPGGGQYDTVEMARAVLPEGPEYALGRLAARFSFDHYEPHRALSDALVTRDLFLELLGRFERLDAGVLEAFRRLGMSNDWSIGPLASQLIEALPPERRKPTTGPIGIDTAELTRRLRPQRAENGVKASGGDDGDGRDLKQVIDDAFSDEGHLSRLLSGYESRPEQSEMAVAVAGAIEAGRHLVVEAGTGVGKSLAYLIPAAAYAIANGKTVVVSTNTINLQEQLVTKDLDTVGSLLRETLPGARPLSVAQLKGRANYLCYRRWSHAMTAGTPGDQEAGLMGKLLVWLQQTCDGDRSELSLGRDTALFNRMSAQGAIGCPSPEGPCFLRRARNRAMSADVIVINHAMLMSDIVMGGGLLPPHDVLVIDEAHHLQDAATRHLGFAVSQQQVAADLAALGGETGAVADYLRALQNSGLPAPALDPAPEQAAAALRAASEASEAADALFPALASFAFEATRQTGGNEIRLTAAVRGLPAWEDLSVAGENFVLSLGRLANALTSLLARQERIEASNNDAHATLLNLSALAESISEMFDGVKQALQTPQEGFVYWLSVFAGGRAVEVRGAPLDVGPLLKEKLFDNERCVILTGATLSYESSFDRLLTAIGLEDPEKLILGSPFDYKEAALISVPEDIAEPGGQGYAQDVAAAIASIARGVRGRTLALFTSNSALESARRSLVDALEPEGIKVIGQGHDGPPHRVMRALSEETDIVALGVSSLWEGADMAGARLDALVMARLPFPVPSEPVFSARSEQYEDGFTELAVPEAVLRFRQGFGRLIRSKTDRGVFVILDRRIISKGYGRSFQRALPKATVRRTALSGLEEIVRAWKGGEQV